MRKFPATIRTASNAKTRDSVIPSTCEGTEYGVYGETHYLRSCMVISSSFFVSHKVFRLAQRVICGPDVNYLDLGKTETTVDSLLTDTSLKRTLRVGPCLCLFPVFDSL